MPLGTRPDINTPLSEDELNAWYNIGGKRYGDFAQTKAINAYGLGSGQSTGLWNNIRNSIYGMQKPNNAIQTAYSPMVAGTITGHSNGPTAQAAPDTNYNTPGTQSVQPITNAIQNQYNPQPQTGTPLTNQYRSRRFNSTVRNTMLGRM